MTKPKELKVGDRVKFVRVTAENSTVDPPIGAVGTIKIAGREGLVLRLDDPIRHMWGWRHDFLVSRDELRKLPDRKEG
jgi:hypothetical protein